MSNKRIIFRLFVSHLLIFEKMFVSHLPRPNIWGKTVAIWAAMVARWSLAAHVGSGALLSRLSLSNEFVGDIANTSWSKIHPKWHIQTMQAIVNKLWASHSRQTMTGTSRIYINSKNFKTIRPNFNRLPEIDHRCLIHQVPPDQIGQCSLHPGACRSPHSSQLQGIDWPELREVISNSQLL